MFNFDLSQEIELGHFSVVHLRPSPDSQYKHSPEHPKLVHITHVTIRSLTSTKFLYRRRSGEEYPSRNKGAGNFYWRFRLCRSRKNKANLSNEINNQA